MDAKKYLGKLSMMKARIKNKQYEIEMLQQEAINPATACIHSDGVSSSLTIDRIPRLITEYTVIEEQIKADVLDMLKYQQEVIAHIEQLNVMQYDFLHKHYVQGLDLYEIASVNCKSYSWATTTHSKAIKNLQKILDEER